MRSRGLAFTLQCDNWITYYRWRSYNEKEPETLDWIDAWMHDGDTFFDVGANIGVYTIYAALRHPRARVVAFEPEYANLHLLKENLLENGIADRVMVYSVALSNRSAVSYLNLQDLLPGSALHTVSAEAADVTLSGRRVVWREGIYGLTLDEFCDQTGLRPNCMKIDVDGTEPEVIEGGLRTLDSPALRSIMIEMPDGKRREDCERLLDGAGFRAEWRDPRGATSNEVWVRN